MLEKVFKLTEHHTDVKTEITAGITTFMTMAYILAVNPSILGSTGMDSNAVLIATCIASFIGTLCMAFMANLPFALSAGMGLNAYMAYTVVQGMELSWQIALFAVFVEGIVFIIMSLTNVREAIFNAIPLTLKKGVSVGIGLFIAFIGLQNAGLSVDASTLVTITSFTEDFHTKGICALLAVIGLLITAIFHIKKVKGGILYGILITWGLGIICELTGIYTPDAELGAYSLLPAGIISTDFSALGKTFGQCFKIDFHAVGIFNFIVIVFSFLFVDLFDTLGTLIGVSTKANMLDENGKPTCEYVQADGTTVTGAYDCVPLLDQFIAEHPDASYHGAKGMIALTGYDGILGYRTDIAYKTHENLTADQQAWLDAHPDFNWDDECAEAKKVADAIKDDGWEFASHTWGHIRIGDASMERIQTDTQKWLEYVAPLVGGTDTIIFAHGQDLADWHDYTTDNEKFNYLSSQGFHFYCNVDSSQYFLQIRDNYVRQGRRNLDGYRLWNDVHGDVNRTSDLFDASQILDPRRTDVPAL